MAKYFPEFGWQPIILTTPLGENPDSQFGPPNDFRKNNRVIETYDYNPREDIGLRVRNRFNLTSKKSYMYVRPFLRFLYKHYLEIIHYPDEEKSWKSFAVVAGSKLLQKEKIDAMISSSSPVTCHLIAKELKKKYKIPWVADLRDLWSQNENHPYGPIRRFFHQRLEVKTLQQADALVTVSSPSGEKLGTLHKKKRMFMISNGFDPNKISGGHVDLTSKFTITYTGQIYTGKRDPSKLLAALKDLISEKAIDPKDVEVRFYGHENRLLAKKTEEYGLTAIVKKYGIVSREVSFEKQKESQLLLLLKWEDPRERGVYSGKVFEYLAAMRPILATGGSDDVVTELLNETNAGVDAQTVKDIKSVLRKLYTEYKRRGKVSYHGDVKKINKYSYREMAKNFASVLNDLM